MEQTGSSSSNNGQFIFLSRNSKLARMFADAVPASGRAATIEAPREWQPEEAPAHSASPIRAAATACPKLQAVSNPSLELTRPLAAALMREQAGMRCRARGVLLDNEYVRDICAAGSHQHCPFLRD